ncbi:hypothetical protein [Chryseobacterium sp.]|uniref:hypothetical protein n=1 Tax=Chryseobacterium sp. TaxID=1871047 RepID=UPI0025BE4515|nr:hypothetical protein [Chryseobacterium sp.]
MKSLFFLLLIIWGNFISAQDLGKIAQEIQDEGIELYRSEMASWYGTDVFRVNYDKIENIGGYFSYIDNQVPKCYKFTNWDSYIVVSKKYISIWNGKSNKLLIMKEKAFKKMAENIAEKDN